MLRRLPRKGLPIYIFIVALNALLMLEFAGSGPNLYGFQYFCLHDLQRSSSGISAQMQRYSRTFAVKGFWRLQYWYFCAFCAGISMSKWTPEEVKAVENGGNEKDREVYLASYNPAIHAPLPKPGDLERIRHFIKVSWFRVSTMTEFKGLELSTVNADVKLSDDDDT